MIIETQSEIDGRPDDVYAFMLDMERVVSCMPGATLLGPTDSGHDVEVVVVLGPISVTYAGTVSLIESDDAARRAVMKADAREKRGQGRASATLALTVSEVTPGSDRTRIMSESDVMVTGRVAQMGNAMMQDVATTLFTEMAEQLESALSAESRDEEADSVLPAQAPVVNAPRRVQKLSVFRLAISVVRERWRRWRRRRADERR